MVFVEDGKVLELMNVPEQTHEKVTLGVACTRLCLPQITSTLHMSLARVPPCVTEFF